MRPCGDGFAGIVEHRSLVSMSQSKVSGSKMSVVVHSSLGDAPLKVQLDSSSTQELKARVSAHYQVEADALKLVRVGIIMPIANCNVPDAVLSS